MNYARPQESSANQESGKTNVLSLAILFGAIIILVAAFLIVQQLVRDEKEMAFATAQDFNTKIALSDEVRIRSLLASLDKVILVFRRDFMLNPKLSHDELMRRLDELQVQNELNPRLSILSASGDVLFTSAQSSSGGKSVLNLADRPYFQKQKSAQLDLLQVSAPIQSRTDGKWVMPLTRRITNKDGTFGGIVSMSVEPSLFTEPFEGTSFGENATRAIIGLDGYTLVRLNGSTIVYGGDTRKSQVFKEIEKSKAGSYTAIASSDGVKRSVSYRVINPYGILILAGSSVASIEKSYSAKVQGYILGGIFFGSLFLAVTGLVLLTIARQRKFFDSQQRFSRLIEVVPQMVCGLDKAGNIAWVNGRTMDYVGPGVAEKAAGLGWLLAAVHPEDADRLKAFVASAVSKGADAAKSCEYRKRRFDGTYRWFASHITSLPDTAGSEICFIQTGTEIHERKMAEERSGVAQKLETIGQLTGGLAHDFNNLLAIIVGNLDLAKSQQVAAAATRQIDVAMTAAQRGVMLVKSLLALASKQPLLPAKLDLGALVERVAPLLSYSVGKRVRFTLNLAGVGLPVEVDEAGLEAVLLNLAVNARDAMPHGGDLTLSLGVSGSDAVITLSDNGTGMAESVLKRATEPFFTTKERGHGTGLGLSMVAGFVRQSRGTMKIQSSEGRGTMVEIFLPLVSPAIPTVPELRPSAVVAAQSPVAPAVSLATGSKSKILIVDDEPALTELVRAWVMSQGHIVVLASTADDALTLLAVRTFDVLLTDIMMPGALDGLALAEKAREIHPAMKIVLMSGYSKETATNRADVPWPLLVKPFQKEDLFTALK